MAGFIPAIHVLAALDQAVDARVKPGHDESWAERRNDRAKGPTPPDWPAWTRRCRSSPASPPTSSLPSRPR
nr:hypothetical protein CIT39_15490 [Bradyrhizobium symbiodeficiens]QDF38201.1 hypothetical protein FJN17_11825 [Bradyrhizobium symbiodeficiens]